MTPEQFAAASEQHRALMAQLDVNNHTMKSVEKGISDNTAALHSMERNMTSGDAATASALEKMQSALMSALKVPVAVAMIVSATWLFYMSKITEKTWMIFCLVSMFPWFGDSIRMVFDLFRGGPNTSRERVVAGAKIVVLSTAALALFTGCRLHARLGVHGPPALEESSTPPSNP